jgi:hypothetical protein
VVVFDDLQMQHPTRLSGVNQSKDEFLRKHFRWCLRVHVCGGDISVDIDKEEALEMMDDAEKGRNLNDKRWGTTIGREIVEMTMELRMQ